MTAYFRSLGFNLLFFGVTAVLAILCLPVLLLPAARVRALARWWVGLVLGMLSAVVGLRHQIRGAGNLPEGAAIVAAKHQSAWDTLIFQLILPDAVMVVKRELFAIPFFGWYMRRLGMLSVDRAGGMGALKSLVAEARGAVARGQKIVIFPEGTRTPPGTRRPYLPGVAALYRELGVPVVPVALDSGRFWGRRRFVKHAGVITLEFLAPIAPGMDRKPFMKELSARIEDASDALA